MRALNMFRLCLLLTSCLSSACCHLCRLPTDCLHMSQARSSTACLQPSSQQQTLLAPQLLAADSCAALRRLTGGLPTWSGGFQVLQLLGLGNNALNGSLNYNWTFPDLRVLEASPALLGDVSGVCRCLHAV